MYRSAYVGATLALLAGPVLVPSAASAAAGAIEEVVVTATKREEGISEVPIAVSAFSGADLEARGVQDIFGLQSVAPSIAVYNSNGTAGQSTIRIRGVGTTGNNPGLEAAVGTFVDGVYLSRSGQAMNDIVDVAQIEILRGPQGTLFGKNTSAGALVITTKGPEEEFGGHFSLSGGDFDKMQVSASVTGGLVEGVLAGRLSASYHERDGYYEIQDGPGEDGDNRDRYSVRGQLLWTPSDRFDSRLIVDYSEKNENCCPAQFSAFGPSTPLVLALGGYVNDPTNSDSMDAAWDFETEEETEELGISLTSNLDLADATVTSILAYRNFESLQIQDVDFTAADILGPVRTPGETENYSIEVRAAGSTGQVDWLGGVYAYTEDIKLSGGIAYGSVGGTYVDTLFAAGGAIAPLLNNTVAYTESYDQETKGWSVFTRNTWHMTDLWSLTLGLRYSDEEKDATGIINGAAPGTVVDLPSCALAPIASLCDNQSYDTDRSEQEWTGTASLAYALSDSINVYASYSRGYKAGGFNLDQEAVGFRDAGGAFIDESNFEPEFVDAYELGLKGTFLDGRLTTNIAAFYQDFEDFQLNTFTGLGFFITNLPKAESEGIEFESTAVLSDWAFLTFGLTYNDARYGDNLFDPLDPNIPGEAARIGTPNDPNFIEGKRLTQSAKWQGATSLFLDRKLPNVDLMGFGNINVSYRSKVNTGSNLAPEKEQDAVTQVNVSAGVRTLDERYEFSAWVNNLTDEKIDTVIFDSVFQAGSFHTFFAPPRMYGATLKINF